MLIAQDVEVIECRTEIKSISSFIKSYFNLWKKHRKLNYDILIIPTAWDGILTFPLAKIVSKGPIVYRTFMSIYETNVYDRKIFKPGSFIARALHIAEKIACKWSNMIITETCAVNDYFVSEYGLNREKFQRIFLSADEDLFPFVAPKKENGIFDVLFFGTFIPLHGIDVIIKAAKILSSEKNIQFRLCGDGQEKDRIEKIAKDYNNVKFMGFVKHEKLQEMIRDCDVCLGIFDGGEKANKVITNKVFQILSSGRSLITRESKAVHEINLIDKKNCILVRPNDPESLANAIIFLKQNPQKSTEISMMGHKLFSDHINMDIIGKQIKSHLEELIY